MHDGRGAAELIKNAARPQVAGEWQQKTPVTEPHFNGIATLEEPQEGI